VPVTYKTRTASDALKSDLSSKTRELRQRREARVGLDAARTRAPRNDLQPALRLVKRSIASLKPMERKVRRVEPEQVRRIARSIERYGQCAPVIIRPDGTVVDGTAVVEALKRLGATEANCVVLEHLSPDEARGLRVTINRLAELGFWDEAELSIELGELVDIDLSLVDIAFTMPEIDVMAHVDGRAGADFDDGPDDGPDAEPPAPAGPTVTRPGDLWLLGDHRVVCGDSLDSGTYARLMAGATASAVVCDPPYNCPIAGFVTGNKAHREFAMAAGEMSAAEFTEFLRAFLASAKAHLRKGSLVYACIDWRTCHLLVAAGAAAGLKHVNTLVWNKGAGGMGSLYRSAHELIPVFCHGDKPHTNNVELGKHGRDRTNVVTYPGANRKGSSANAMLADHPTPKPVELVADLILDCTVVGDVVLDPFLGSGTAVIAAEKTRRAAYGVELDPAYVDLVVRRWERSTGGRAVHAETGATFAETEAERGQPGADRR